MMSRPQLITLGRERVSRFISLSVSSPPDCRQPVGTPRPSSHPMQAWTWKKENEIEFEIDRESCNKCILQIHPLLFAHRQCTDSVHTAHGQCTDRTGTVYTTQAHARKQSRGTNEPGWNCCIRGRKAEEIVLYSFDEEPAGTGDRIRQRATSETTRQRRDCTVGWMMSPGQAVSPRRPAVRGVWLLIQR